MDQHSTAQQKESVELLYLTRRQKQTKTMMTCPADDHSCYKQAKEEFVTGHNGTDMWELTIQGFLFPASLLLLRSVQAWIPGSDTFVVEFLLLVVPTCLGMTVLADYATYMVASMMIFGLSSWILTKDHHPDTMTPKKMHLTNFRSGIMLMTCSAILAVDFPVFPRRFVKTETYGTSLMDIGVGAFVVSGGLVSRMTQPEKSSTSLWTEILRIIPLLVLGAVRIVIVWGVDYQEHVSEYGVHWNFFFTLACLSCLTLAFERLVWNVVYRPFVDSSKLPRHLFYLGCFVLLLHQWRISYGGIAEWIDSSAERTTLIEANKEGLTSTLGFLGLHLMAVGWGGWERQKSNTHEKKLTSNVLAAPKVTTKKSWFPFKYLVAIRTQWCILLLVAAVLYVMLQFSEHTPSLAPSRKMANATYCLWVFLHNVSILGFLEMIDFMYDATAPPTLSTAVNKNQLVVFLIANQITGAVNLSMRTVYVDDARSSMAVVLMYMGCVSLVAWVLRHRRIKL